MRFGSAASGIEAASMAWKPLGFKAAWYSEIDPFCCSLLRERHGTTPNLGDMNEITTHALRKCGSIDVLVAGTPCQSFSVAGERGGITDPRGQLAHRLLDLVEYTRPRWFVWENVPGVFSSWTGPKPPSDLVAGQEWEATETSDFGQLVAALAQLGYGWAYRVYDAQFAGVPQRRRRVFLVGHLGDWRRAAAVLFEPHCVSGDSAPSREAKPNIAGTITAGSGRSRGAGVNPSEIVAALTACGVGTCGADDNQAHAGHLMPVYAIQEGAVKENINIGPQGLGIQERIAYTLEARHHVQAVAYQCHGSNVGPMGTLRAGNGNETGGVPFTVASLTTRPYADNESHEDKLVPVAYRTTGNCGAWETGDKIDTLTTGTDPCSHLVMAHGQAGAEVIAGQSRTLTCNHEAPILFDATQITSPGNYSTPKAGSACHPLAATATPPTMIYRRAVRRLTPRECERLMGFPDDYTLITHRGKPAADGPRYKAIGNSIAIPDLRWIGQRIRDATRE